MLTHRFGKEGTSRKSQKSLLLIMLDGVLVDLIFDAVVVEAVDEVLNGNDFLGIFV